VLPFVNLSGDATRNSSPTHHRGDYFGARQDSDLRVVGRESAFQFKGEKKDLRVIGQALIATHLLEGSVRKAGNRVRVAVQLIKTDDGKQIWSESYDRELTDVVRHSGGYRNSHRRRAAHAAGLKPARN